jgi:tetratricopeptide (TPR) repeat protein
MRSLGALLALLALVGGARASGIEADDPALVRAPPARTTGPATVAEAENAAQAVEAALASGDEAALKALATQATPDPWEVADTLVLRGRRDAALRFARATSGPANADLAARVEAAPVPAGAPATLAALRAYEAATRARRLEDALAALANAAAAPGSVLAVRVLRARGEAHERLARWEEAQRIYAETGEAAESLGWLVQAAQARHLEGHAASRRGAWPAARTAWERRLALEQRRANQTGIAEAHLAVGQACERQGADQPAISHYESAANGYEELGDQAAEARARRRLANAWVELGKSEEARAAYQRALSLETSLASQPGVASTLLGLGNLEWKTGQPRAARPHYERALEIFEALGDKSGAASVRSNLGSVLFDTGEYEAAAEAKRIALAAQEALGDRANAAATLSGLGRIQAALGDYTQARASLERGLKLREELGDPAQIAAARSGFGSLYWQSGEYPRALDAYRRALQGFEAHKRAPSIASTLANMAPIHRALGEYAKALACYDRALDLARSSGLTALEDSIGGNAAILHASLGDHATARSLLERSLAGAEARGELPKVATKLENLGRLALRDGDFAAARPLLERSLSVHEQMGNADKVLVASAVSGLGVVLRGLREWDAARSAHARAGALYEALGHEVGAAGVALDQGLTEAAAGAEAAAQAHFERARRLAQGARATDLVVQTQMRLAHLALEAGKPDAALALAQQGLTASELLLSGLGDEQGAGGRGQFASLYGVGALAAARTGNLAEAFSFLENGRAGALLESLDRRETLRWKTEALPEALRDAEARATASERRARAAYQAAVARKDRAAREQAAGELDAAQEELRHLQARVQREAKHGADLYYPRARSLEEVQAGLPPGEALVVVGLCLEQALALVVSGSEVRAVDLGARGPLESACAALALGRPDGDAQEPLAALRTLLVAPLALAPQVRRVRVSPEGSLCFLPWGALFDLPVAVAPSGSTLALLAEELPPAGEGILAVGDPEYGGAGKAELALYHRGRPLARLPGTRQEVEAITQGALLGAAATEAGLRLRLQADARVRWRAVHLACHGLIDPERPTLSALALTPDGDGDGFLTALEILRMQVPADLVVLSACETATGRLAGGEGIVGLTRAFMHAGAPRVLCSLWKVDDEATAALMTYFYALWNGKDAAKRPSVAEALRDAQAHVRAQPRWSHPHYWAAWVLWGLP